MTMWWYSITQAYTARSYLDAELFSLSRRGYTRIVFGVAHLAALSLRRLASVSMLIVECIAVIN